MNSLRIYNTLARDKQPFVPLRAGEVRMYVCGMTVYDYCHVGHARMMIVFDMVQRWLRTLGYKVTYVRNITDIDDKIIRARGRKRRADQGADATHSSTRCTRTLMRSASRVPTSNRARPTSCRRCSA